MQNAAPPLNPQLIGQTENALRAILNRQLAGTGVTYPQWVALLVTATAADSTDREQLASRVAGALKVDHAAAEAHFQALASGGLIETGTPSSSSVTLTAAGQRLVDAFERGPRGSLNGSGPISQPQTSRPLAAY